MLEARKNQYVIFPLIDKEVWKAYKDQVNSFWTVDEVSLADDVTDFKDKLNDDERHYIKHTLAFFAASDGIVAKNIDDNFTDEASKRGWMEAMYAYQFQTMMENIHNEAYSKMIEVLVSDDQERDRLFNALEHVESIKRKAQWAMKWMNDKNAPFAKKLVAFAAVEGIFFSGSFCSIYWLKFRGMTDPKNNGTLLPGVCKFNELIARDEGMHQSFHCLMYRKEIERDPSQALSIKEIHSIFEEAVNCEKYSVNESLPVRLVGMNAELMCQHIEYTADRLLGQLRCPKLFNSPEPFSWYELVSMSQKTNFFEERVSEYAKPGSGQTSDQKSNTINFETPF